MDPLKTGRGGRWGQRGKKRAVSCNHGEESEYKGRQRDGRNARAKRSGPKN